MIPTFKLLIKKPDDSHDYHETSLSCEQFANHYEMRSRNRTLVTKRINNYTSQSRNPVQEAIKEFLMTLFTKKRRSRYYDYETCFSRNIETTIHIGDLVCLLQKKNGRHHLNGVYLSLSNMCDALARVLYRSCFTDSVADLNKALWGNLQIPENVSYVLENRLPYFFFTNYERHDVRLNVQQIGTNLCAIEISDGVWAEITYKALDKYCNFYVHGKKRGDWPFTSPKNLFTKLMKREPSNSELDLMVAFLQQNRKQDIVEKRAFQLISDMVDKNPYNLFPVWEEGRLQILFVRGKGYDWKLECRNYKASGTQNVSTFVWQPSKSYEECKWQGAICIDNLTKHSSVGDQFAARALALMNDDFTIKIVRTIDSYITSAPNINRADINEEMQRMRDN